MFRFHRSGEIVLRPALFVRALLALLATAALSLTLLSAPLSAPAGAKPAPAAPTQPRVAACFPGCWGAISFNTATGISGGKYDTAGKDAATSAALRRCKTKNPNRARACVAPGVRNTWVKNGCLAIWYRTRNGRIVEWAKGSSFYKAKSIRIAKRIVNDGPGEIHQSAQLCTTKRGDYPTLP